MKQEYEFDVIGEQFYCVLTQHAYRTKVEKVTKEIDENVTRLSIGEIFEKSLLYSTGYIAILGADKILCRYEMFE